MIGDVDNGRAVGLDPITERDRRMVEILSQTRAPPIS